MNVGDRYKFIGIPDEGDHAAFGPWGRGGECEGKVVEVQEIAAMAGNYPIEIALWDENEVEWPDDWSSEQRRFAVAEKELLPLESKPIDHWR